jgi:AsmA protein
MQESHEPGKVLENPAVLDAPASQPPSSPPEPDDFERHEAQEPEPFTASPRLLRRAAVVLAAVIVLALLIALPPMVNVNRYQRRIATSIGASLGRPVHMSSVTLNLLPMPGFTLTGFVVAEDPAFGAEPVIRAETVRATLRVSSLWRGRVEFSTISLTEPSVNLVRLPDGRWNLESILLQASRMPVAPTGQKTAGQTQRFPYIEATGARLNLKLGREKVPFSLTDAELSLWLSQPQVYRLRLEAHPARTDTSVSDTGTLRVEGTLGRAAALEDVPINLTAEWFEVPLGSVSLIALGKDIGMRGEMALLVGARGTVGDHAASARLHLESLRRADFVPVRSLDVDVGCSGHATGLLQSLDEVHCAWPAQQNGTGVTLTGALPNTRDLTSARGNIVIRNVPASALLDGLRVASARLPPDLTLGGTLGGEISRMEIAPSAKRIEPAKAEPANPGAALVQAGTVEIKGARLALGKTALISADLVADLTGTRAILEPVQINLGGLRAVTSIGGAADEHGLEFEIQGLVPSA